MKKYSLLLIGLAALTISGLFYLADYLIFQDAGQLFSRLIDDLGFLPLDIFIVVVIVERVIDRQAKQSLVQKLNMVVGAFFSEVGNPLLTALKSSVGTERDYAPLAINQNWKEDHYKKATAYARAMKVSKVYTSEELEELKSLLLAKQAFLLRLLENPNLLEHEKFTDLLWAVFHLTEELQARASLQKLSAEDLQHINGDIRRIHSLLVIEWLAYSRHLQSAYPYLFSLLVRTQPFQKNPGAAINS